MKKKLVNKKRQLKKTIWHLSILVLFFVFSFQAYVNSSSLRKLYYVYPEIKKTVKHGQPISAQVTVFNLIPFKNGSVKLKLTSLEKDTTEEVELWSGETDSALETKIQHIIPPLSLGKHKAEFIFDFTLKKIPRGMTLAEKHQKAKRLSTSGALYFIVEKEKIHVGNIDFKEVELMILHKELKKRGLGNLSEAEKRKKAPDIMKKVDELMPGASKRKVIRTPRVKHNVKVKRISDEEAKQRLKKAKQSEEMRKKEGR